MQKFILQQNKNYPNDGFSPFKWVELIGSVLPEMRLMRACSGSRIHIYLKSHAFFFVASVALCEISGNCEINADNTCIYSIISCLSYTSIFQTIFLKNPLGINRFGLGIGSPCHLSNLISANDFDLQKTLITRANYGRVLFQGHSTWTSVDGSVDLNPK